MLLLHLHCIAREGDGLAPELMMLTCQRRMDANANIIALRDFNPAIPDAAGQSTDAPMRQTEHLRKRPWPKGFKNQK